jgi:hypothetical protein
LRVTIFVTIGRNFQQPGETSNPDKQLQMLVLRFCWCLPISRICIGEAKILPSTALVVLAHRLIVLRPTPQFRLGKVIPKEQFAKLFGNLLVFVYHCFDRIVINGYLCRLSK